MSAAEVRQRAAKLIEQRGWCQDYLEDANGSLCAVGALLVAAGLTPKDTQLSTPDLRAAIDDVEIGLDIENELTFWNDEDGRTQAEVVAALRGGQS